MVSKHHLSYSQKKDKREYRDRFIVKMKKEVLFVVLELKIYFWLLGLYLIICIEICVNLQQVLYYFDTFNKLWLNCWGAFFKSNFWVFLSLYFVCFVFICFHLISLILAEKKKETSKVVV